MEGSENGKGRASLALIPASPALERKAAHSTGKSSEQPTRMIRASGRNPPTHYAGEAEEQPTSPNGCDFSVEIRLPVATTPRNQPALSPDATGRRSARPDGATTVQLPACRRGSDWSGDPPAPMGGMRRRSARLIALYIHDNAWSMPSASICFLAVSFTLIYTLPCSGRPPKWPGRHWRIGGCGPCRLCYTPSLRCVGFVLSDRGDKYEHSWLLLAHLRRSRGLFPPWSAR